MHALIFICLFLAALTPLFSYDVTIEGLKNVALSKTFKSQSLSYSLKDKPLQSYATLKRRAENDVEKLTELAHFNGYYSAHVSYTIQYTEKPSVTFHVDLGPRYILKEFRLEATDHSEALATITINDLGITLNKPIHSQAIIDAEKNLLWQLKKKGYAASQVITKVCKAFVDTHTFSVHIEVSPGPLIHFGPTQIVGNTSVINKTIEKSIMWKKGQVFDPTALEKTQAKLEKTGLFTSVILSQDDEQLSGDQLPVRIQVQESKHHSIGAGLAYATSYGPGIKAEWENRNLRGHGEKLTFRAEAWQKYQSVILNWTKPHFRRLEQDLIWRAEYDKLHTVAFDSKSYNLSGSIYTRYNNQIEFLKGLRGEWLYSTNFEGKELYHLVKVPLLCKWSNADNLLDPTSGHTINIKLTPTSNFMSPRFFYTLHTTSLSTYQSFFSNHVTIAAKLTLGNIMGAARNTIPPPDRIYGGSENVLRGFRAYTISPLHNKRIPIGGRSMLAGTLEARLRSLTDLGWVFFYDVGNVYSTNMPKLTVHQFHSVGTGFRYATPLGPLRLDVAVPINRRPNLDPHFQIYFSIGQAF